MALPRSEGVHALYSGDQEIELHFVLACKTVVLASLQWETRFLSRGGKASPYKRKKKVLQLYSSASSTPTFWRCVP